jgi:lactate dehydrogenase-like 2-hydroxyacid dehydrogenase
MSKPSVFVSRLIPEANIDELKKHFDVEVNYEDRHLSRDELQARSRGRDALLTLLTDTVDRALLDSAGPQLKIVANFAVGFNNFDLLAATERGVILTNTPGVLDDATATHTWALLLATARRIVEADKYVREGRWKGWSALAFLGLDVDGKTLGVAGMGRIGVNVARKARSFNMNIIYTDTTRNAEAERHLGCRFVDKETLLKESDFITLHVPLTPDTRHYIGQTEFNVMKKSAVVINASRGPVVDEKALIAALRQRQIWGAGLDVYENEPQIEPGLTELENVVVVPHIASSTIETRLNMGRIAVRNIINVMHGQPPETCVNPDVLKRA